MFQLLGNFVRRAWPGLLVGWAVAFAAVWYFAPPWDDVVQRGEFAFLPDDAPTRRGEELFKQAFPGEKLGSNVVLVLHRAEGEISATDKKFVADVLKPRLEALAKEYGETVEKIRTPGEMPFGALLLSPDKQAALVLVELTADLFDTRNWPLINRVEETLAELRGKGEVPSGLDVALTGSAVIGRDWDQAEREGVEATEFWAVLLVVVLLIVIYRAPLLTAIPLLTVYVGVEAALKLLALMAQAGWVELFEEVSVFVTVLGYGAGIDYCLFLIARAREETGEGSARDAVAHAIRLIGPALLASAGTTIVGIGMMYFSEFGKFRQAGLVIPVALTVVLVTALTFSPSLLLLVGRWAYWPKLRRGEQPGGFLGRIADARLLRGVWDRLGGLLVRRPGTAWLTSVLLMAPFAVVAVVLYNHLSYGLIAGLPDDVPSRAGTRALEAHFPAGVLGPVTILIQNEQADFRSKEGLKLLAELTERLKERRAALGAADLRSVAQPLGVSPAAKEALANLGFFQSVVQQEAVKHYVSDTEATDGHVTRLEVVPEENPFTRHSIEYLEEMANVVRAALPESLQGATVHAIGATASLRDLRDVTSRDRLRLQLLVTAAVFGVLLLLLRRVALSLYLIVSVLYSYFVTLGVTFALFWLLDMDGFVGLDWKVPVFLFTILVAVGEDYNIFLVTRVDEEQAERGPVEGVREAVVRTGGIISSCGVIMAGTFASMLAASLVGMQQMGFALAFGVLLDTLVVRPVLVPAFLILVHQGRFGRLGRFLGAGGRE